MRWEMEAKGHLTLEGLRDALKWRVISNILMVISRMIRDAIFGKEY
jgi:hypothetical protein